MSKFTVQWSETLARAIFTAENNQSLNSVQYLHFIIKIAKTNSQHLCVDESRVYKQCDLERGVRVCVFIRCVLRPKCGFAIPELHDVWVDLSQPSPFSTETDRGNSAIFPRPQQHLKFFTSSLPSAEWIKAEVLQSNTQMHSAGRSFGILSGAGRFWYTILEKKKKITGKTASVMIVFFYWTVRNSEIILSRPLNTYF